MTTDIDPEDLRLCLHSWPLYKLGVWEDRRCSYCQGPYDGGRQAHIVVGHTSPPVETALCADCLDGLGDYGNALRCLRDGVEAIDSAMAYAGEDHLARMVDLAVKAVGMVTTTYTDRSATEAAVAAVVSIGGRS